MAGSCSGFRRSGDDFEFRVMRRRAGRRAVASDDVVACEPDSHDGADLGHHPVAVDAHAGALRVVDAGVWPGLLAELFGEPLGLGLAALVPGRVVLLDELRLA